ncbi:oligosaccharide flippase family protein [Pectobacterium aroidearum]|uniref:oligosaccharide flippase family protein n=1 Tax=Pectobacterium aroidearum TaxID=1201031 RepID=UPI001CD50A13|nr:oligosaccharide flippase family protein [Pectobacterium aroidearum]
MVESNRDIKKKLGVNIVSLGMLQFVNYINPILLIPFLITKIGIDNIGIIAIATAVCAYFQICFDYGFNLTATREIAQKKGDSRWASFVTSAVLNIKLLISLLLLIIFLPLVFFVPDFSSNKDLFLISYILCVTQSLFPQWHFQAVERMGYITITNSIPKFFTLFIIFSFVNTPSDTWKVLFITLLGALVSFFWAMLVLKRKLNYKYSFNIWMIKKQLIIGKSIFFARFFSTLYKNANILILGAMYPASMVGVYSVAEKIIRSAQAVQNVIGDSLFPMIVKNANGKSEIFRKINFKYKYHIIIFYFLCSAFVFYFSDLISKILVRHEWMLAGEQLRIMSLVFFFGGLNYFYGILGLVAHGFNSLFSKCVIISGIFNVIACYTLVLNYSIWGASITMALSEFLLLVLITSALTKARIIK